MSEQFMMQHGDRLVAGGFPILPIVPGEKFPGTFQQKKWFPYKGWMKHAARATTEHELAIWKQWPQAGIGVVGGVVAGIDIDVTDAAVADELVNIAYRLLGTTPAVRIGHAPKRMLVYRTQAPFKGIKAHPLEVLCLGQQFVSYAIHPGTGQPYQWPETSLADLRIEDLPVISEAQARAFIDEGLAILPESLRPARLPERTSPVPFRPDRPMAATGEQRGTFEAVADALRHIVNADLPYDDWVRIGLAIKGALSEDGAGLFAEWSASSGKNVPEATARAWASFRPAIIGAGTLYHLAQSNGWSPDAAITLNPANKPPPGPHPAAEFVQKLHTLPDAAPREDAPPFLDGPEWDPTDLDGVLGLLVNHMLETATRPQPILAVGNALCALGALMGHRYRTETNLRSNLYIVGIADSGSGKNHSREVINKLFFEAKLAQYLGGNKIASGSGLLAALKRHPALLFQQDEFGMFFQAVADRRHGQRYLTEILDLMTELYTASGTMFLGTEYASVGVKTTRQDITQPCLCVYGTTTPHHFWSALQSTNVVDGSLARFLILPTDDDYPEENENVGIQKSPASLLRALARVANGGIAGKGNLAGLTTDGTTAVDPMVVPMEPSARVLFKNLKQTVTNRLRQARGTPFTSLLSRIGENAAKVALIRGVSFNPTQPVIREQDAAWAIALVEISVATVIRMVEEHVADNIVEHNHKRVLGILRNAGPQGITKTELGDKSRFLTRRDRNEILADLLDDETICTVQIPSKGKKPITVFRFQGKTASAHHIENI